MAVAVTLQAGGMTGLGWTYSAPAAAHVVRDQLAPSAAHNLEVSGHCSPALQVPVAATDANLRHLGWFADHARLEPLLVAGAPDARDGEWPVLVSDPGQGMRLSEQADRWRVG